ncbi:MAG TPA: hypothetical protein VHR36_01470 [Pyrinomonadaceae bacterium]|jgi:hypothetical protein|nr:hypothetical protein [Pyrinomonadaceae bacterium]
MTRRTFFGLAQLLLFLSCCLAAMAQPPQERDYLTPKEVDLVKDAQELDKRIDVFIKAANRRVVVIKGLDRNTKELKNDAEFWGDLPAGTRSELVGDIARILDAAIDNIDDVSYRDEKNPALPRVVRKLASAATHIVDELKPLQASAADQAEVRNFEELMDNAETIVAAAGKLGPDVVQPGKKTKGEKAKTN